MSVIGEAARSKVPLSKRLPLYNAYAVMLGWVLVFSSTFVGGTIGLSFPFSMAVPIIFFGTLNNALLGGLIGAAAARTGFSNALLMRYSYGRAGVLLPSVIVSVTMIGWFAFILGITAEAVTAALGSTVGTLAYWGIFGAIGVVMMIPAVKTIRWMAYVSWAGGFGYVIILAIVTWFALGSFGGLGGLLAKSFEPKLPIFVGLTAAAGGWIAGSTYIADFARYFRTGLQAFMAIFVGYGALVFIQYVGGAMGAIATGEWNIFLMMAAFGMLGVAVVALLLGAWSTNQGCVYLPGLALSAPPVPMYRNQELTRRIISIAAWIIAMIGGATGYLITYFLVWIQFLAWFVAPVAITVVIDYWVFSGRRKMYERGDLPDMRINPAAIVAWIVGFAVGYLSGGFFVALLNSMFAAGIIYYAWTGFALRRKTNPERQFLRVFGKAS